MADPSVHQFTKADLKRMIDRIEDNPLLKLENDEGDKHDLFKLFKRVKYDNVFQKFLCCSTCKDLYAFIDSTKTGMN